MIFGSYEAAPRRENTFATMLQNPKHFCNVVSLQVNIPLVQLEKALSSRELCAFPRNGFSTHAVARNAGDRGTESFELRISAGAFQCPGNCVLRNPLPLGALKNQFADVSDFARFRSASISLRMIACEVIMPIQPQLNLDYRANTVAWS